jgi:hypothetical protein
MSRLIAVIAAGLFAAGTIAAADPNKCAEHVAACKASLASFDVAANKKTLFNQILDNFQKNGCAGSSIGIKQFAQATFTPEQFTKFNAECGLISAE